MQHVNKKDLRVTTSSSALPILAAVEAATGRFQFTSSPLHVRIHEDVERLCTKALELAEELVNPKEFIDLLYGDLARAYA